MLRSFVAIGFMLCLCGCSDRKPPDPADKSTQFSIPPDIEKAWRKVGAYRTWIQESTPTADSELGVPSWTFCRPPEDYPCEYGFECQFISGFGLDREAFKEIANLPEPPDEFCLALDMGTHGDFLPPDVAQLTRFKNLVGLRISAAAGELDLTGAAQALPNVRFVDVSSYDSPSTPGHIAGLPKLEHFSFRSVIDPQSLQLFAGKELKSFPVEQVDISVPGHISGVLAALRPQPTFQSWTIEIAPEDWHALMQETSLKSLDLSASRVTDAMLLDIAKLPQLQHLYLATEGSVATATGESEAPAFTPEGVRAAFAGRTFRTIELPYPTPDDDKWFAVQVELISPEQTHLYVGPLVSDAGLASIQSLKHLESVGLSADNLTDAAWVHLEGLANLKYVVIYGETKMTSKGAAKFQEKRPEVEIEVAYGYADQLESEEMLETPSAGAPPAEGAPE